MSSPSNVDLQSDNEEEHAFGSSAIRSVVTKHRVSLPTTEKTLKYMSDLLHLRSLANRSSEEESEKSSRRGSFAEESVANLQFGPGGFGDRSTNHWDWPLGQVQVRNEDSTFTVKLHCKPYKNEEIEAFVLGNELNILCKQKEEYATQGGKSDQPREVHRMYQLPLDVDPTSAMFQVSESGVLTVVLDKLSPLIMSNVVYGHQDNL